MPGPPGDPAEVPAGSLQPFDWGRRHASPPRSRSRRRAAKSKPSASAGGGAVLPPRAGRWAGGRHDAGSAAAVGEPQPPAEDLPLRLPAGSLPWGSLCCATIVAGLLCTVVRRRRRNAARGGRPSSPCSPCTPQAVAQLGGFEVQEQEPARSPLCDGPPSLGMLPVPPAPVRGVLRPPPAASSWLWGLAGAPPPPSGVPPLAPPPGRRVAFADSPDVRPLTPGLSHTR
eukprot:TRINITY_DN33436_c0_g1_i1.p2 TRINITY_DN33436_c0_g1~~TRINITY_DN33436_c0_g1_i1.p2  ORF type:complete len:228 (+),score=11.70 TRINITY_DN33436_c0_g1_i1:121-804(+)